MKIKVYIVTYKRPEVLNANLKSLWQNTQNPQNIEVTVLSNHPECIINEENKRPNLCVIYNTTRMPHAWGYLSRDWNWCILDCFKTWKNPDNVDWLVLAQNDVTWVKNWNTWLEYNKKYDLVSQPLGDQCIALNIEAVKKIGFFDERLTTLHFQESDYFIRAIAALKDRCSINDGHYKDKSTLNHNPLHDVLTHRACLGFNKDETLHNQKNWHDSNSYIKSKYSGFDPHKTDIWRLIDHKAFGEINWYPFFWDGYDKIKTTFIEEYKGEENGYQKFKNRCNKCEKINTVDISVVVQGAIDKENTPKCLASIRKYLPEAEIILSTWEGSNVEGLDYDKLVLNEDPGAILCSPKYNYYNNINRQLLSTQNGLKECYRKYAMKMRTDNILTKNTFLKYFNKFPKRCEQFKLFEKRMIVLTLFSRRFFKIPNPFRISDWVTFGLTEDVKKYYLNIELVKEPEFSLFFQNHPELNPKDNPSRFHFHRYTTEQYYPLKCFQKFYPEIKMEHLGDFNKTNIEQSNIALANNFIFLDYSQHGIYLQKANRRWYDYSKDESRVPDVQWKGFIRHYIFLKDYKKYCDPDYFVFPVDIFDLKRNIRKKCIEFKNFIYSKKKEGNRRKIKILGLKINYKAKAKR